MEEMTAAQCMEGHGHPFPLTSWRRFLLVVIIASESLESYRAGSVRTDRLMINYLEQAGSALPPTKVKAMGSLHLNGTQGGARTRTQTTVDSLAGRQTALPAPIPSGGVKEPSATSESSTPTATEAARPASASHASRWREETCGDTSPELGIVSW